MFISFRRSGIDLGNTFGAGTGQIWLDDVDCLGNENALEDCFHNGWGSHNCVHGEDVSISCSTNLTDVIGKAAMTCVQHDTIWGVFVCNLTL